ncbi:hypothetical protein E2P81_ATG00079 [Venturia nashicola]|uniref:Uncharacterized protein n=1 Tax=Venturia nashicola TaxID=86259 RepID=A0A4Z1PMC9_9PEZI|nr:hypothetical protein E6O75_ATG00086 [Venturia nashicola]TLD39092.1 hypothetical protein E2P81_ATG00079 [Venturia nashicola]
MFLLLSLLSLALGAIARPLQILEAQTLDTQSIQSQLSTSAAADACLLGKRIVIQDAKALNTTLLWEIGTINAEDGEQFCRTVIKMDYDNAWQYAVTGIDWRSNAEVEGSSQAAISLLFSFENTNRITRYKWTIDAPKDAEWRQSVKINAANQQWSPCRVNVALSLEWRIGFYLTEGKKGPAEGVLGVTDREDKPLELKLGVRWRKC